MKVCDIFKNVFIMRLQPNGKLFWECLSCGITEEQKGGCLLMETLVQERSSEAYKLHLTDIESSRQDPALPHVRNIKCPKETCASNTGGAERDVIYIKYDAANMKYMYICSVCEEVWRSRS